MRDLGTAVVIAAALAMGAALGAGESSRAEAEA
jgi:hypothetical protein